MSSLSIIPAEILECITSMVSTSQQMRLWLCGDRILNIKLKNGGLKRTSLCWSDWTWMPWPRDYFTVFDGLVDVKWDVAIGMSLCPTLELILLPKTLNRLHIACEDVFILLRQQNINMNHMLPLLQSLHLSGSRLREENLKNLSSNLRDLYVASPYAKFESSNIFSELPRRLRNLKLVFGIVDQSELENDLPSELVSLEIQRVECNFDWFSKLPKSLEVLIMAYIGFETNWHTLPPQLWRLDLSSEMMRIIPKSALLQLPQSLKSLGLPFVKDLRGDELGPLLPKNLKQLSLAGPTFSQAVLQKLPASLIVFDVTVYATNPDVLSFYSPEALSIRLEDSPELNIFPLPTQLLSLEIEYINDQICAALPPKLLVLKTCKGRISIKGASKLPKSLERFSAYLEIFDDNESISFLRHISNITLKARGDVKLVRKFNKNWISSLLPSSTAPPTSAKHARLSTSIGNGINECLTTLSVCEIEVYDRPVIGAYIQKPFFEALPNFPNLNTLEINSLAGVSSDSLGLIPKNVTDLSIGCLAAFPTASQLLMLPKCLIYLHLTIQEGEACDWNDETLQSLPRSLQEFSIFPSIQPKWTQPMHEYLPPNLWSMDTATAADPHFYSPLSRLYGEE